MKLSEIRTSKAFRLIDSRKLEFANLKTPDRSPSRSKLSKNFYAYLELGMQSKHDKFIQNYCSKIGVEPRRSDGTQIFHKLTTIEDVLEFYQKRGDQCCEIAMVRMAEAWKAGTTLQKDTAYSLNAQGKPQRDGWRYDASYYYDGHDIHVTFHGYPG